MARRRSPYSDGGDDVLDVIDLLADDTEPIGRAAPPEPDEEPTTRGRPRWLVIAVAVVVVGTIGAIVVTRDGPGDSEVGILDSDEALNEEATRSSPLAPRSRPFEASSLRAVNGRYVAVADDELVLISSETASVTVIGDAPTDARILAGNAEGALVVDGNQLVLARPDSSLFSFAGDSVFPSADGTAWLQVTHDHVAAPEEGFHPVQLPADHAAISSTRDGYLLHHPTSRELGTWTPGGNFAPFTPAHAIVIATHPDRVAWVTRCPGSECGLHVTDLTTHTTVALRPDIMPAGAEGGTSGRFSPDGRYLALGIATNERGPSELSLVDLTTGLLVVRSDLRIALTRRAIDRFTALPFAFTGDSARLVVPSEDSMRALDVINTGNGVVMETVHGVGRVESIAALDAPPVAATAPLFDPAALLDRFDTDATLALANSAANRLTLVDFDTGATRDVDLPRGDGDEFQFSLLALTEGFAWISDGHAWWIPIAGDPVDLGAAGHLFAGSDRSEAWAVTYLDRGYEISRIDGTTGSRGPSFGSHIAPFAAVRDGPVVGRNASFAGPASLEIWDPASGETRNVEVPAEFPMVTAAAGDVVVWYDQACRGPQGCPGGVTNVATGSTVTLPFAETNTYSARLAPDGSRLYAFGNDGVLQVIDLTTLAREVVPGAIDFERFAVSAGGAVVYQRDNGVHVWEPGWAESESVSTATFDLVDDIAVR
jgi:hypothetical protein